MQSNSNITLIMGTSTKGTMQNPIVISATTPLVRWWQFWRWHKASAVRDQRNQELMVQVENLFGTHQ